MTLINITPLRNCTQTENFDSTLAFQVSFVNNYTWSICHHCYVPTKIPTQKNRENSTDKSYLKPLASPVGGGACLFLEFVSFFDVFFIFSHFIGVLGVAHAAILPWSKPIKALRFYHHRRTEFFQVSKFLNRSKNDFFAFSDICEHPRMNVVWTK